MNTHREINGVTSAELKKVCARLNAFANLINGVDAPVTETLELEVMELCQVLQTCSRSHRENVAAFIAPAPELPEEEPSDD